MMHIKKVAFFIKMTQTEPYSFTACKKPSKLVALSDDDEYLEIISRWRDNGIEMDLVEEEGLEKRLISLVWSLLEKDKLPKWAKNVFRGRIEDIPGFLRGHWVAVAEKLVEKNQCAEKT
ncbi:hypothetical protein ACFL0K_00515 [Patescibacteria group bacterium]